MNVLKKSLVLVLFAMASLQLSLGPVFAQVRSLPLVRDAETEALLRSYAAPILKAAGLGSSNINIILVGDTSFNAFVVDGRRIFINIGVLMQAKTPNEVIGVLAHEFCR